MGENPPLPQRRVGHPTVRDELRMELAKRYDFVTMNSSKRRGPPAFLSLGFNYARGNFFPGVRGSSTILWMYASLMFLSSSSARHSLLSRFSCAPEDSINTNSFNERANCALVARGAAAFVRRPLHLQPRRELRGQGYAAIFLYFAAPSKAKSPVPSSSRLAGSGVAVPPPPPLPPLPLLAVVPSISVT